MVSGAGLGETTHPGAGYARPWGVDPIKAGFARIIGRGRADADAVRQRRRAARPGISKAGNKRPRGMMPQVAWGWLRNQPHSELSRWHGRRFGSGGKRQRRIGIVALARKLLVKLWQYLQTGAVPEGAALKT